jgi:hypothetical protein
MHPDTRQVAEHMREFGLSILGRAIYDATFSEMTAPFSHALAIVHAAHGAEIVLKARIVEEHPLLVFSRLPALSSTSGSLTVSELFEYGRSYDYSDLPNVLWAATGHRLQRLEEFQAFGKLRNQIMHFAVPEINLAGEALKFCIEVMEPVVYSFWQESCIPYAEQWDGVIVEDGYLEERLVEEGIEIPSLLKQRHL